VFSIQSAKDPFKGMADGDRKSYSYRTVKRRDTERADD
jgi:hypothetical protein